MSVEQLNNGIASARQSTWNVATSSDAILCQSCSRNQLLKIKQLANFVPYNDVSFTMIIIYIYICQSNPMVHDVLCTVAGQL